MKWLINAYHAFVLRSIRIRGNRPVAWLPPLPGYGISINVTVPEDDIPRDWNDARRFKPQFRIEKVKS